MCCVAVSADLFNVCGCLAVGDCVCKVAGECRVEAYVMKVHGQVSCVIQYFLTCRQALLGVLSTTCSAVPRSPLHNCTAGRQPPYRNCKMWAQSDPIWDRCSTHSQRPKVPIAGWLSRHALNGCMAQWQRVYQSGCCDRIEPWERQCGPDYP